MDRRSLIKRAGLAGVAATIAAPAVHAQATVRWRLAHSFPKSLDTIYGTAETFAKLVSDMSGGKFVISVFAPGRVGPALTTLDAVQKETVECTHTASNFFAGKDETFAFNGIPFSLNSRQMSAWMFEGNGLKLMREFYRNYGVISFPMGNTGAQMGGWFRKEINSLGDLKRPEDARIGPCLRARCTSVSESCRRPSPAVIFTRRWNEARLMPSSSPARSMIRSSASTRSPRIIIIRAGTTEVRSSISLSG